MSVTKKLDIIQGSGETIRTDGISLFRVHWIEGLSFSGTNNKDNNAAVNLQAIKEMGDLAQVGTPHPDDGKLFIAIKSILSDIFKIGFSFVV